jgi:stage V sporulation protein AC
MRNTKYEKIANFHKAPEKRIFNSFIAFVSGGIMGLLAELIIEIFGCLFGFSRVISANFMIIIFIFIASLCTGLGFFDKLVTKFKCGLLIPITGFAHSMTSSSMDYRTEGFIYGIGSNMFKLAGSVIIFGVVSAYVFGLVRFLLFGGAI